MQNILKWMPLFKPSSINSQTLFNDNLLSIDKAYTVTIFCYWYETNCVQLL